MDLRLIKNVKICLRISFRIITNVVSKVATEENHSNENNNIAVTITVLRIRTKKLADGCCCHMLWIPVLSSLL